MHEALRMNYARVDHVTPNELTTVTAADVKLPFDAPTMADRSSPAPRLGGPTQCINHAGLNGVGCWEFCSPWSRRGGIVMQKFGFSGASRFLRANKQQRMALLGDLQTQFQRDRKLKQWNKMVHSGNRFAFSDGPESYLLPVTVDDLGSQLFIYGEAEFSKVRVAMDLLERSRIGRFLDVGANVGHIVIPGLKRGLFEQGIAVEPDPTNFGCLAINAELNGVAERLQLVHAAAGEGGAN